jgi:hypothetical protein
MLQIDVCETVKLSSESTFEFSGKLPRTFAHHQKSSYHLANEKKFNRVLDATIYHMMRGEAMKIGDNESYYTCFGLGLDLEFYVVHNGVDMARRMRQPSTSGYHSPQDMDFGDQRLPLCRRAWPQTSPHLLSHEKGPEVLKECHTFLE